MDLLFDSNILVLLIKRMGGETEGLVIIVVWSALIVSRWVVVAWGRMFCLGLVEISSLVFLVCLSLACWLSPAFHSWLVFGARDTVVIRGAIYNATKLRREIYMLGIGKNTEEKEGLL